MLDGSVLIYYHQADKAVTGINFLRVLARRTDRDAKDGKGERNGRGDIT